MSTDRHEDSTTLVDHSPSPAAASGPTASSLFDRGLDTTGGVDFVRQRMLLLGKTVFLLSSAFFALLVGSMVVIGGAPFVGLILTKVAIGHLLASSCMGLIWLLTRKPTTSRARLGAIDLFCCTLGGVFLAFMAFDDVFQVHQATAAVTVTVLTRAILVPSRPRRTLVITSLMFLPIIIIAVVRHHPTEFLPGFPPGYQKMHLVLNTTLWSALGVTLATVASRVTYGLRRQVAEVSELGQYILEEKIGGGGMGEVWRGRHRLLIRPAAVKIIRRDKLEALGGDPALLARRFEREARATAALRSPHTVQLYDFGTTDDGTLYYVMELLEGLDLDTLVRRHGPLPAERGVHILRQVCRSLADAHENGLVHRDIKPANIVVSRVGTTYDFVKVLDFGLVKLDSAHRIDEDAVKLTAAGSTSGTPGFMAPEVVLGVESTDFRVDIYSFGCVAYWLLTGKLVFEGDTPMQVMIDHARTPAPRMSSRVELPIPAALEDLVMECLEKEPARRPSSIAGIHVRLGDVQLASEDWSAERAEKWWSTHRPRAADARPVADILLSHEGREMHIGPRVKPRG